MTRSQFGIAPRGLLLLACLLTLGLAGCGQRGPLFLPDAQTHARSAEEQPADAQSQDDDDTDNGGTAPGQREP